jgi:hypothetical protein
MMKNNISCFAQTTYWIGWILDSIKLTCFGVIDQVAKINLAHAVAPLKQWFEKWRLSVGSTGPLRYYRIVLW